METSLTTDVRDTMEIVKVSVCKTPWTTGEVEVKVYDPFSDKAHPYEAGVSDLTADAAVVVAIPDSSYTKEATTFKSMEGIGMAWRWYGATFAFALVIANTALVHKTFTESIGVKGEHAMFIGVVTVVVTLISY